MTKLKKSKSSQISLNKFISTSGYCSRRAADRLIKDGKVKINGQLARPIDKVGADDKVYVQEKEIKHTPIEKIYLAFNKPLGVICTTDDSSPNNIMNYIKIPQRVFPIGRLDVKSEGLILLTNDGELTQQILKGKTVEKEYEVTVSKSLTNKFIEKLQSGIRIDNQLTLPAKVNKIDDRQFIIIIVEGRKRQIRRMCEKYHYEVLKLIRVRIGKILLDKIPEGKFIEIDAQKISDLISI